MIELFGSTIWARQTLESDIFFWKPDKWFKIWFFLINRVNHKPTKQFERGQCFTSYKEIAGFTKASKDQIKHALAYFREAQMIHIQKATRGMTINVLNYAKFQDAIKTKSHTKSHTKATQKPHYSIRMEECNNITPNGESSKPMLEEVIEVDDLGETISKPKPAQKFGKTTAAIAIHYCVLTGKTSPKASLVAAKELCQLAQHYFPNETLLDWEQEIKGRIEIAKKYYDIKGIKEWSLRKVGENWNKILTEWKLEVNKHQ